MTEINIMFNDVFDKARRDGTLRDPLSYPPFKQVFEAAMKGKYLASPTSDRRNNRSTSVEPNECRVNELSVDVDDGTFNSDFECTDALNDQICSSQPSQTERQNTTKYSYSLRTNVAQICYSKPTKATVDVLNFFKRPRRQHDEVERLYTCDWPTCNKAYGYLHHLNTHISNSTHGPQRTLSGNTPQFDSDV